MIEGYTMETAEGSFPDSADNLEEHAKQTLLKQAEMWLRIDGVLHNFSELFKELKTKMAHWGDRGPEDYDKNERDLRDLLASAVREGARRANVQFGDYNSDGGGSWNKWIVPGLVTLAVTGVIGNIIQYAEVASLKTAFTDFATSMERRVNNLEQRVYRGNP